MPRGQERFSVDELRFSVLADETTLNRDRVFARVKTFTRERDGKNPVSSATWIFLNGIFRFPKEVYHGPHQIYLAWEKRTGELVDIAGIVPDDKGVAKDEGLVEEDKFYFGFFGGHYVMPEYRSRGAGTLMIQHRKNVLQQHVNKSRRSAAVYAFLYNPVSGRNLEKSGFENKGTRFIKGEGKDEWLFRLQVDPQ